MHDLEQACERLRGHILQHPPQEEPIRLFLSDELDGYIDELGAKWLGENVDADDWEQPLTSRSPAHFGRFPEGAWVVCRSVYGSYNVLRRVSESEAKYGFIDEREYTEVKPLSEQDLDELAEWVRNRPDEITCDESVDDVVALTFPTDQDAVELKFRWG